MVLWKGRPKGRPWFFEQNGITEAVEEIEVMALIEQLQQVTKQRQSVHNSVEAAISVFTSDNGTNYIQIDTYGSRERVNSGHVNQSIQFGREAAEQLKNAIAKAFPDLA